MADKYPDYAALRASEVDGRDFRIFVRNTDSAIAIIAPHGGKIERGTSEIAKAIAGETYRTYCFEGRKNANNRDLHITSTNFDEPTGVGIVQACDHVVAIHGCADGEKIIYLGGRDIALRDAIRARLDGAGFATGTHSNPNLQGLSLQNICNRGRTNQGVQLEISADLRDILRHSGAEGVALLERLAQAVRSAIDVA